MTTSSHSYPLMKGRVEARPLNLWVHRHKDTPMTFPGQPHFRRIKQGVVGFPRSSGHFLLSENMEKMTLGERKGSSPSWSMVSKWSLGKCGRTQPRAFPKHVPKCSGCSLEAVRQDHKREQSQTCFVIAGSVPELTNHPLKHLQTQQQ